MEVRCELTELLVDQCGCRLHRNSEEPPVDLADYRLGTQFRAAFDGRCALIPEHPIAAGDLVAMAHTNRDHHRDRIGTVCTDCAAGMPR